MDTLFGVISTTNCLIGVVIVVISIILYKYTNAKCTEKKVLSNSEGNISFVGRKLDEIETLLERCNQQGLLHITRILLLKCQVPLTLDLLSSALESLVRRHIVLRSRIEDVVDPQSGKTLKYFCEIEGFSKNSFNLKIDDRSLEEWGDVVSSEQSMKIDSKKGPLWRMTVLKKRDSMQTASSPEEEDIGLVFSIHHGIVDGTSMMSLIDQLLELLNQLVKHGKEMIDNSAKRSSFPLTMPELLPEMALGIPWWQKLLMKVVPLSLLTKFKDLSKLKETLKKLKAASDSGDVRTCIFPIAISKDITTKLINACRKHQTTVHGAATAAAAIGLTKILQLGKITKPETLSSGFNVNMRHYIPTGKEVPIDSLGSYASGAQLPIHVAEEYDTIADKFWKFAKELNDHVHMAVNEKRPMKIMKLVLHALKSGKIKSPSDVTPNNESVAGRDGTMFNISNLGRAKQLDKYEGEIFNVYAIYTATAQHHKGHFFVHNLVTIQGQLHWSLVYYTNVASTDVVKQYANNILNALDMALN